MSFSSLPPEERVEAIEKYIEDWQATIKKAIGQQSSRVPIDQLDLRFLVSEAKYGRRVSKENYQLRWALKEVVETLEAKGEEVEKYQELIKAE